LFHLQRNHNQRRFRKPSLSFQQSVAGDSTQISGAGAGLVLLGGIK
jgi:hypothetical protein